MSVTSGAMECVVRSSGGGIGTSDGLGSSSIRTHSEVTVELVAKMSTDESGMWPDISSSGARRRASSRCVVRL